MTRAFNLREFLAQEPSQAHPRMTALLLLMAIRDGADLLVIETDPTPDVVEARMGYRCGMTWYELVPCPYAEVRHVFPALLPYLRQYHPSRSLWGRVGAKLTRGRSTISMGTLSLVLDEPLGEVVVTERVRAGHVSIVFQLPHLPQSRSRAAAAIETVADESFMIEFDDTRG